MTALKKITNETFEEAYTLRNWEKPSEGHVQKMKADAQLDMGWGNLIFSHTFLKDEDVVEALRTEKAGQRHIAFYTRDPHVLLSLAPQEVFLDPSHTYRLWFSDYDRGDFAAEGFTVRRLSTHAEAEGLHGIYLKRQMFPVPGEFIFDHRDSDVVVQLIAKDEDTGEIIGGITGVDHMRAFSDPENGSSFWCLAVDPQTRRVGVGEALVRACAEHFRDLGRDFLDLSVMHDNHPAIGLYEKLGFNRVPIFCIKRKNPFNEPLFVRNAPEEKLNPYAEIITREARRRGIDVQVLDEEAGYFALSFGGRSIVCRESLTEATTAIAMSRCQDKQVTTRILRRAGLRVPDQRRAGDAEQDEAFLERYGRIVVKPANGEQGAGVAVDIRTREDMEKAIAEARGVSSDVVLEQYVEGQDLRIIVIGEEVVAAAVRRPPEIRGTGQHTIRELIEKLSRRRSAATGGESSIPLNEETERCIGCYGYDLDTVLGAGETIAVRKTANLHTGGTIHDVTPELHPELAEAAVHAARALNIPVVGLDFMVPDVAGPEYVIIEANERPGLANHEPQPTAEKFIDFLFPLSAATENP